MVVVHDIEIYSNYFLASFKREDGKLLHFEKFEGQELDVEKIKKLLSTYTIVTFNGDHFDLPILQLALDGASCKQLKDVCDAIIKGGMKTWNMPQPRCKHIDVMAISPGATTLKMYGARMNAPKLQDLPIDPGEQISPEQREILKIYCENDLDTTFQLYNSLSKEIALRDTINKKYGLNVTNKSDPQIAEAILKHFIEEKGSKVSKRKTVLPFKYNVPDFISFKSPELNALLSVVKSSTFSVTDKGQPKLPEELNNAIEFRGAKYKFGIGGLHSQEKRQIVSPSVEGELFGEFDVTSMYPAIILGQGLYPKHLHPCFVDIYRSIFETRVKAKREGDTFKSNVYKLILNSSYGKFGSKYSFLYSPELLVQTTVTGQLSLLMLVEMMSDAGGKVVSANTDGVNVLYDESIKEKIHDVATEWEFITGYGLEYTPYQCTYSRDVNSYIAVKENGYKLKGAFAKGNLMKNFANIVCIDAAVAHLISGKDYKEHIRNETDITKFLTIRRVAGGAVWRDEYLGKAVRWYYSTDGDAITYKLNGNRVAKTLGAKPMMTLSDTIPDDLDYERYFLECEDVLQSIGV
jgi:hypothetical protein